MNILSYNTECPFFGVNSYNDRLDLIIDKILMNNITILLLQELFICSFMGIRLFAKVDYMENRLRDGGYGYFMRASDNWIFQNSGLFVASKYPIMHISEIYFPQHEREEFFTRKGALIFQVEGYDITFVNTHLHCMHQNDKYDKIRMEQLQQIKDELIRHNITQEIIIGGDMNIDGKEENEKYMVNKLINLFKNGQDIFDNYSEIPVTSPPNSRLDYIVYYGKKNKIINGKLFNANTLDKIVSDHIGVIGLLVPK